MGKVVDFAAKLKPSARFNIDEPGPKGETLTHTASSAGLMLKILTMPREHRIEILAEGVDDPVLILFAMLAPNERREVIRSAETFLKTKVR
jgi:hypothetical protein